MLLGFLLRVNINMHTFTGSHTLLPYLPHADWQDVYPIRVVHGHLAHIRHACLRCRADTAVRVRN
jgi:hypothetical protein